MYISQHTRETINQDLVNDALRRSTERRRRQELKDPAGISPRRGSPARTLRSLAGTLFGSMVRP